MQIISDAKSTWIIFAFGTDLQIQLILCGKRENSDYTARTAAEGMKTYLKGINQGIQKGNKRST